MQKRIFMTFQKSRLATLLGFSGLVLVWGAFPIAAKIGVRHVPPLLFSSVRFLLAFVIMAMIACFQRKSLRLTLKQHRQVALISLLMVALPGGLFFIATPYAPVSILTLMWSTTPIFTALFAFRDRGEVHGYKLLLSLLVGALGLLIVLLGYIPFFPPAGNHALSFGGNTPALLGELGVLVSAAIYGFGLRLAKKSDQHMSVIAITSWQILYSGLFLALLSLILEHGQTIQPDGDTIKALIFMVVFCSCITFFLTFWLIRRIGAIRLSYSDYIIPGITLILANFILHESVTPDKLLGFGLVIVSVILVSL